MKREIIPLSQRPADWLLFFFVSLFAIVFIILHAEKNGVHPAPNFLYTLGFNAPWLLAPLYLIYRMWRDPHPFSRTIE